MTLREGLRLAPAYHERVWGGQRLQPSPQPIGEAWIVHEENRVVGGASDGRTLAELVATQGEALLGRRPLAQGGARFPLLIKLLDARDWLSVQVHPNDAQAVALEGPGQLGKTEAWHILDAAPGARLICGLPPGTTHEALAAAIRQGTIVALASKLAVAAGDTVFIPAGTVHALGPGLFLYEVQQTSDITYRVYDWDRPQSAGRKLHIEQSLAVTDPGRSGVVQPRPHGRPGESQALVACPYFALEEIVGAAQGDTAGESFHALTVIAGEAIVAGAGWEQRLSPYESVVVPADCGAYTIAAAPDARTLLARVPLMAAAPRRHPLLSLAGCRRIVIMGTTGAGKTTLSAQLAWHLGVSRIELDALNWGPNWTMAPREQFRADVAAVTSAPAWVADGNYRAVRDILWPRADTIIWLDYPLAVNFWRLTRRILGRVARREELWHGNRESLRTHFLSRDSLYVWAAQTHRRHQREWSALFASGDYPQLAVVRFRSPGSTRRWLARVTAR